MTQLLFSGPFPEERRLEMDLTEFTIGREDGCDLMIDDSRISRRHARVVWRLVVEDLGSTNGLWLRGRRVRLAVLEPDERICVGGADRYFLRLDKSDIYPTPDDEVLEDSTVFAPAGGIDAKEWDRERTARLEAEILDLRQKLDRARHPEENDAETPLPTERLRAENRFLFERVRELEARLDAAERIRQETEVKLARLLGSPEDSAAEPQTRFLLSDDDTDPGLDDALEAETAFSHSVTPPPKSFTPVSAPEESNLRNQLAELLSSGKSRSASRPRLERDLLLLVRRLHDFALGVGTSDESSDLSRCLLTAVEKGDAEDWQALHQRLESLQNRLAASPERQTAAARDWSARLLSRLDPETLRRDLTLANDGKLDPQQRSQLWSRFERVFEDLEPDLLADELISTLQRASAIEPT